VQVLTNALDAAVAALEKSLAGSKPDDPRDLGQSAQAVRSIYCKIDQIAAENNQSATELVHDKVINQRISQTFLTLAIAATNSNIASDLLVDARALLERGGNGDRASELSNRINSAFFSLYIRTNQLESAGQVLSEIISRPKQDKELLTELTKALTEGRPAQISRFMLNEIDRRITLNADREAAALVEILENARISSVSENRWPSYYGALRTALSLPLPNFGDETARPCRAAGSAKRRVWALLVGINDDGAQISGPSNDVALLKRSLVAQGIDERRIIMIERSPSREETLAVLQSLLNNIECEDFVFFHWSSVSLTPEGEGQQAISELPQGWAAFLPATANISELMRDGKSPKEVEIIRGIDIAEFVTAVRNKGASIALFIDADAAAGLGIELFQDQAEQRRWTGRANPETGKLLPISRTEKLTPVSRDAGDYAVFYAANRGFSTFEMPFNTVDGKATSFGVFSYALAKTLQTASTGSTVQTLAEKISEDLYGLKSTNPNPETARRLTQPLFVASDPQMEFLRTRRIPSTGSLDVNIITPAVLENASTIQISAPTFGLVGRVDRYKEFALVTVDSERVSLDDNGQFQLPIQLKPGRNSIIIAAVDHSFHFFTKVLEFKYENDLERSLTRGQRYALVIGIQNYDHFTALGTPISDAKAVANLLRKDFGFTTELVRDNGEKADLVLLDATLRDITSSLNELRKQLNADDSLLIYYGGHGYLLGDNKVAYWVPKDGLPDDQFTWLSASQLTEALKRLNARSILVVSDSCFSGAMTRDPPDLSAFSNDRRLALLKSGSRKARLFISSGGVEPVADAGCLDPHHSVFACAFLSGLKEIREPIFSSGELHHMYLIPAVSSKTAQQPERREIRDSGHDGGDFVFSRATTTGASK